MSVNDSCPGFEILSSISLEEKSFISRLQLDPKLPWEHAGFYLEEGWGVVEVNAAKKLLHFGVCIVGEASVFEKCKDAAPAEDKVIGVHCKPTPPLSSLRRIRPCKLGADLAELCGGKWRKLLIVVVVGAKGRLQRPFM